MRDAVELHLLLLLMRRDHPLLPALACLKVLAQCSVPGLLLQATTYGAPMESSIGQARCPMVSC